MNDIEGMMATLPRLKHLELRANCTTDVVDGERWQMQVKNLVTFNFKWNLSNELESEDLESFRTSFWLEEKRWFVAYVYRCLFSVPHFCLTATNKRFEPPLYSTIPDNDVFYDCIQRLQLYGSGDSVNRQFNHVETLDLISGIPSSTIQRIVNINRVQHLILHPSMGRFSIKGLINKMPNLRHIEIRCDAKEFVEEFRGTMLDQVQTLEIYTFNTNSDDNDIEQLCHSFPKIKHLRVNQSCSTKQIFDFLSRFKHLSSASFHYAQSYVFDDDERDCRLKIQSALDRVQDFQRLNYTYRLDSKTVHLWIRTGTLTLKHFNKVLKLKCHPYPGIVSDLQFERFFGP
jgi:hypothetical protein